MQRIYQRRPFRIMILFMPLVETKTAPCIWSRFDISVRCNYYPISSTPPLVVSTFFSALSNSSLLVTMMLLKVRKPVPAGMR